MPQLRISVCLDDEHLYKIEQVAEKLKTAGMNIEQTLSSIGIISGSVENEQLTSISQVEGVKTVEKEETYHLSPPDSNIQ